MALPLKENRSSKLLSSEENNLVFKLLGTKCLSQCTTVAEIYTADPPRYEKWRRFGMGVLCFVKDSLKRSYFMRLYSLKHKRDIWEQEIYDELHFSQPKPFLLIFEGHPSIICLNFAIDSEAEKFGILLKKYLSNRKEKTARRAKSIFVDQAVVKEIPDVIIKQRDKLKPKRGIRKEDIGKPTNFVHVESGSRDNRLRHLLEDKTESDTTLSKFLDEAGVTPRMMNNRKTREVVRSFIEDNHVLQKIRGDSVVVNRPAPQVPRARAVPKMASVVVAATAPAPPPPPPPAPIMTTTFESPEMPPIQENSDPDFLSEIHKGIKLTPVVPQKPVQSDGRVDLMQDIQRGIQLKSAKARRMDSPMPKKEEGQDLANAMHRALTVILTANHNSSDEEVDGDSFDNWDDE